MLWLGIVAAVLVVIGGLAFLFINNEINKETARKNKEFTDLVEFGNSEKKFETFATYAARTRFSEITFYKENSSESYPVPKAALVLSGAGTTQMGISAKDADLIKQILSEIKKGKAVFTDPKDSPLMYSRPYLKVEFDGGMILKIEDGNLG